MIFRLSQKLATKIKTKPSKCLPLDPNPFADWSGHLFTADRTQYLILTNTPSLYSVVMFGKGISDDSRFIDRALECIWEFMLFDGQEFIYRRLVVPASASVRFSSALNRSVIGSVNDMVKIAQLLLDEDELSPFDVSFRLNDMPMSCLEYAKPREAFKALQIEQVTHEGEEA